MPPTYPAGLALSQSNQSSDTLLDPLPSALSERAFVERFGALYEHSPWVAQRTWQRGVDAGCDTLDGLAKALAETLSTANPDEQRDLILAHPDLAGRAAARGELTDDSTDEQASAGLDQCTPDELERFHRFNDAYKARFGFPFIMAVKGSNRFLILQAFEERLENEIDVEFARALQEINKIARLRLQALHMSGPHA